MRRDVSDETVYSLAQQIFSAEGKLKEVLPQAGFTTAANTARYVKPQSLLHPGVLKFLKNKKLID